MIGQAWLFSCVDDGAVSDVVQVVVVAFIILHPPVSPSLLLLSLSCQNNGRISKYDREIMNGPNMYSTAYACVNQPERRREKERERMKG